MASPLPPPTTTNPIPLPNNFVVIDKQPYLPLIINNTLIPGLHLHTAETISTPMIEWNGKSWLKLRIIREVANTTNVPLFIPVIDPETSLPYDGVAFPPALPRLPVKTKAKTLVQVDLEDSILSGACSGNFSAVANNVLRKDTEKYEKHYPPYSSLVTVESEIFRPIRFGLLNGCWIAGRECFDLAGVLWIHECLLVPIPFPVVEIPTIIVEQEVVVATTTAPTSPVISLHSSGALSAGDRFAPGPELVVSAGVVHRDGRGRGRGRRGGFYRGRGGRWYGRGGRGRGQSGGQVNVDN